MPSIGDLIWPIAVSVTEALSGFSRVIYVPSRQLPCPTCQAQKEQVYDLCEDCDGSGLQTTLKRIMVDIPPLRDNLQRLKVRGAGDYIEAGNAFRDLVLVCHIRPESNLSVTDGILLLGVDLSATQAENGGTIEVTLLNQPLAIELPPSVGDGQRIALPPDVATVAPLPVVVQIHVRPEETARVPLETSEVDELCRAAAAAEAEGCFEVARDKYAELTEQVANPKNFVKLSAMHLRLGATRSAVEAMQRALKVNPDDADLYYYLAICQAKDGNHLMAAVELERARRLGFPAVRARRAHRRIITSVFRPTADLTPRELECARDGLELALDRYYGAAAEAYQEMLGLGERSHAYYWLGAANWLLTVEGDEDCLASAYIALTEAGRSGGQLRQFAIGAAQIREEMFTQGSLASKVWLCTHFVREVQAQEAQDYLFAALRDADRMVPGGQRELSTAIEASQVFEHTCETYVGAHVRVQSAWQSTFSNLVEATRRMDTATADGRPLRELMRGELSALVRTGLETLRDSMVPALRGLESELEEAIHISPRYHLLLEQVIEWITCLVPVAQSLARCWSGLQLGRSSAQQASADALVTLSQQVGAAYADMELENTSLGRELSCPWRAQAFALQLTVKLQSLLAADEPLRNACTLARALELLQASISLDPDFAAPEASDQVLCDLLDEFQQCAQTAAGCGALDRVELLQNTFDALNSQLSPFQIANSPAELMAEDKLKLFDWAAETLFEAVAPIPGEFIIAARPDCYALSSYRLVHRIPDTTTYQVLPLSQIERYDVHVSGVTMRNVLFTLRDGRRVTFAGVRTADVLPHEQVSWLLGARMWQNLAAAELEALNTGRASPTKSLSAQSPSVLLERSAAPAPGQLASSNSAKTCGQCGRENFVRDRFCRGCGAPLETEPPALPTDEAMPKLLDK